MRPRSSQGSRTPIRACVRRRSRLLASWMRRRSLSTRPRSSQDGLRTPIRVCVRRRSRLLASCVRRRSLSTRPRSSQGSMTPIRLCVGLHRACPKAHVVGKASPMRGIENHIQIWSVPSLHAERSASLKDASQAKIFLCCFENLRLLGATRPASAVRDHHKDTYTRHPVQLLRQPRHPPSRRRAIVRWLAVRLPCRLLRSC